jgi:hypothetical protein
LYSPRQIFRFLTSTELKSILNKSFYKRHMESDDTESPFNDPEEILFLEWLIDHNYIIAEYRHDHNTDNESYLLSTLGHAFVKNYRQSLLFRMRSHFQYYRHLHWIVMASAGGSLIATYIASFF